MFHWVLGYRGSRCASPGAHFQRRREGRCVLGIPRLSPLWLPFAGLCGLRGSVCPGYSRALAFMSFVVRSVCPGYTQALAFAAALLFGFRGVCKGRCVPAIAGLSPSCVSRREVGVSWVYPGSRLCGCAPFRVQGSLRGSVCPGYSRALAFLFLLRVQGGLQGSVCPGYSRALAFLFLLWVQGALRALVCPGYSRAPAFIFESILASRGVVGKILYAGVSIHLSQR